MAISRTTKDVYGREINSTYVRIESVEIGYKNNCQYKWREYYNADSKNKPPVNTGIAGLEYNPDGGCVLTQCYMHLKNENEFNQSADA